MTAVSFTAHLASRAVILLGGPDWRGFLQGLITQDVVTLADGEARFAGLLTPQGRLLYDLFVIGRDDRCLIDCAAAQREALIQRLTMYRLRAKVDIAASEMKVWASWGVETPRPGWSADPRLPSLGYRGYGVSADGSGRMATEAEYRTFCLALGVPGPEDWGLDATYPIEANFDLLGGIDFKKGCFVGQETTSRMKRRGIIKNRIVMIAFDGAPPDIGAELLAGELRAGTALSGEMGRAMALVRLDRLDAGPLSLPDGRSWRPKLPAWMPL